MMLAGTTLAEMFKQYPFDGNWKIDTEANHLERSYTFVIHSKLDVQEIEVQRGLQNLMSILRQRFETMPFIEQMKKEHEAEVHFIKEELAKAEAEIKRLKAFENYHNIEMELRHGKKSN